MKNICIECKKDVNVRYEISSKGAVCFDCLPPHMQKQALKDEKTYGWKAK